MEFSRMIGQGEQQQIWHDSGVKLWLNKSITGKHIVQNKHKNQQLSYISYQDNYLKASFKLKLMSQTHLDPR